MSDERYQEIIRDLESRGIMPDRAPTIDPTVQGLKRLGFDIDPQRVVLVAGTNGKGSVCATLEKLFEAAGLKTGLYTSPHLVNTTERIRIGGQDISRPDFIRAFDDVHKLTDDLKLSHFEMLTLMAVMAFHSASVDKIILEVGLGGTWDSTNAIPHDTVVIASIGYDHQNILGKTLASIASNKFGAVPHRSKIGKPAKVIHAKLPDEIKDLARQVMSETQSEWIETESWSCKVKKSGEGPIFQLQTKWGETDIALPGERGAENTALALTAFEKMGFAPEKHLHVIPQIRWPGRMELVSTEPCAIYLSGDHNVPGVKSLLGLLEHYDRSHIHFLAGIGIDKEASEMLELLTGAEDSSLYLTVTPFKGRDREKYGSWIGRARGFWDDPIVAFENVKIRAKPGDMIVVTGSLYLVGLIRSILKT